MAFSAPEQGSKPKTHLIKVEFPHPPGVNLKASELFLIMKEGFSRSFEKILILINTLQMQINSFFVIYNAFKVYSFYFGSVWDLY